MHALLLPSTDGIAAVSDEELKRRLEDLAAIRRSVDAGIAILAAEVDRRSSREFGFAGLAQRDGVRSAEQFIERLTGSMPSEARALMRVGELLTGESPEHMMAVRSAVADGSLSVNAAAAIRGGLGEPTPSVPTDALASAADALIAASPGIPVSRLASQARALRDSLDTAGVAEREAALRERRYLRTTLQPDGMTRVMGLLDPESAAIVTAAFDQVTSPRRGGPRFVDPIEAARAQGVVDDPRSTDQLLADAFVDMVRIAGSADESTVFGQRRPAVTIHVEKADLTANDGIAHFEGQTAAISSATARRWACTAGAVPVLFDKGRPLDVGRTQRLFTERQRLALAARDGGCTIPGCDRPPSWCEAHHINEWVRDHGRTNVDEGILLCRFHHLWVHNSGWRIEYRKGGYVARPPAGSGRPPMELTSRRRSDSPTG